jgi:hypothetical protein
MQIATVTENDICLKLFKVTDDGNDAVCEIDRGCFRRWVRVALKEMSTQ